MNNKETIIQHLVDSNIEFEYYDHEEANNMEICKKIEGKIGAPIFKNLFLQNRQGTQFYLLLLESNKKFVTSVVSKLIGQSRLSFGNEEKLLELLGVNAGSITPLGLIFDKKAKVNVIIDKDVYLYEYVGVHPGCSKATVKMKMGDIVDKIISKTNHNYQIIDI